MKMNGFKDIRYIIAAWAAVLVLLLICSAYGKDSATTAGVLAAETTPVASGGAVTLSPTPSPTVTPTPTPMPDEPSAGAHLTSIYAYYTGGTVIVGEEFDETLLEISAYYDDGFAGRVTEGYELASKLVEKEGANKFVVVYEGVTANFVVNGKSIKSISAASSRRSISVGNGLDERDLTVSVSFSNGTAAQITKDYTISPKVFTETGNQQVTISYKNVSTEITVFVQEAKEVKTLSIAYDTSKGAYTKMAIDRSLITVTAVYTNSTSERITTYELDPEKFSASGTQKLTATYGGKSASIQLNVLDLAIASIRAEYKGGDVYVGMEYDPRDLHVYAKYNSGLEEETEEYKVYDMTIHYIGTNTVRIYLGDYKTSVVIMGKEMQAPDFNYVSTAEVTSNGYDVSIDTAIPPMLDEDTTVLTAISKVKLKHLYRRLGTETKTYLGFKYGFVNNDNERFLPLTVRITLPDEFEPEYTELYYSPNNKTILGCMNKMGVDDNTLEITIFKAGTYMLVYDPAAYTEETEEEGEESGEASENSD